MARSHTFSDHGFARPKQGRGRKLALGATLAAGALLAVALNAVGAQDAQSSQTTELATTQSGARLVAYTGRAVELDQAIMGFRQDGLSINLSVMASDDGQRIFVQEAGGELFQIPLSPGQTNVSAELPAHFADSAALSFRVD
ncbi:MAG: hypothetical protein RIR41_2211 [Pseudomonadota bacterium]